MKTIERESPYALFIQKHSKSIIVVILVLSVFFSFFIVRLPFDSDFDKMIVSPEALDQITAGKPEIPASDYPLGFAILIESDEIYNPELLTEITLAIQKLDAYDETGPNLSPFSFVTVEKRGTRLVTVPMNPHQQQGSWSLEEAQLFKDRIEQDDIAKSYLVAEDGNALLIFYSTKDFGSNTTRILSEFRKILEPVETYARVSLLSSSLIEERVAIYLNRDLTILLIICFLVILATYFLSFRAKRAIFIPLSLSIIGIIWTLGTMQLLGFSLNIINIITPIMVLTLGSSYSIHMLNEYFATLELGDPQAIGHSLQHIVRTIVMACITTVFGFLSLLICEAPAFKEFGISVSIGVVYCALLAITYLPAVLKHIALPKRTIAHKNRDDRFRIFTETISKFDIAHWPVLLLVFVIVIVGFFSTKDRINLDTNYMSYFPKKDPIVQSSLRFAETLGSTNQYHLTLNAPQGETDYFHRPEVLKKVYEFEQDLLENSPDIVHSLSFPSYISFMNKIYTGQNTIPDTPALMRLLSRFLLLINNQMESPALNMLINTEGTQITLSFRNYDSIEGDIQTIASSRRVRDAIDDRIHLLPEEISTVHWGSATEDFQINDILMDDQATSTALSFLLIFLITLIFFRSLKFSLLALVPVLVGVMANYIFMYVFGIPFDLVTVGFSSVTVGVGIDDALHFLIRYRNNIIQRKLLVPDAIRATMNQTGKPIILTSVSIIFGLLTLTFASYVPIQYFGLLVSVALLNTLLATLFMLPAVILLIDYIQKNTTRKTVKRY